MGRIFAFALFAVVTAFAARAEAQTTPDRLIAGHWECSVTGVTQQYERITADFGSTGSMVITFYAVMQGGAIRMTFALSGEWTYDAATGVIDQTISGARIDNMVVNGRPMARSDHPEGEAGLARREQELVAQHADSPFRVATLDERVLVLIDESGDTLNCGRETQAGQSK